MKYINDIFFIILSEVIIYMNSLLILIIIISILCIIYLFFRHLEYNKILESFSTQNSLSTYYSNTVDSDDYLNKNITRNDLYNNKYYLQSNSNLPILKKVGWDGIWKDKTTDDTNIAHTAQIVYGTFFQVNDLLFISLTDKNLNNDTNPSYLVGATTTPPVSPIPYNAATSSCPFNSLIMVAQLNLTRTKFNVTKILCSNYINSTLNINPSSLSASTMVISGYLHGSSIIIFTSDTSIPSNNLASLTLNFYKSLSTKDTNFSNFNKSTKYTMNQSSNINALPLLPDSEIEFDSNICSNVVSSDGSSTPFTNKCTYIKGGSSTTVSGLNFNACSQNATVCTTTMNSSQGCLLYYDGSAGALPECTITPISYDYMNFMQLSPLVSMSNNTLSVCEYLSDIGSSGSMKQCILCYVKNMYEVQTLNYQIFGANNRSLVTQYDILNSSIGKLLKSCSTIISPSATDSNKVSKAISFTNGIEMNNDSADYITRLTTSIQKIKPIITNPIMPTIQTSTELPCLWEINVDSNAVNGTTYNILNSCTVKLSVSQLYKSPPQYAEFNSDGTTSLSYYVGGQQQELTLESVVPIKTYNSTYTIKTCNIKTSNNLYLKSANDTAGFNNNTNILELVSKPEINGKWVIIGLNLTNISGLSEALKNIPDTFT